MNFPRCWELKFVAFEPNPECLLDGRRGGIGRSIARLYYDLDLFRRLSAAAAERVREQCGAEATVQRELALFKSASEV